MLDAHGIGEVIATYHKYGWILRRILLTKASQKTLDKSKPAIFGGVAIFGSEIDAAWFSRPPQSGTVAWELRYLGDIPYALLEKVDESDPEFENILSGIELRLRETISTKTLA